MGWWLFVVLAAGCGRFGFGGDERSDGGTPDMASENDAAVRHLQITIAGRGAVSGTFGVCTSTCAFDLAGDVTVSAYAADAWTLSPASGCTDTTCSVAADVDHIDITFVRKEIIANLAFITSMAVPTNGGTAPFDTQCQTLATAAGHTGTFIAFVSSNAFNARDRLAGSRGWVRPDGLPILDQPTDIGSETLPRGIALDETGAFQTGGLFSLTATGSLQDGTHDAGNDCSNWTVTSGVQMAGGYSPAAGSWLLGGWVTGCVSTVYAYCFETGHNVAITIKPPVFPVGRRIFISSGYLPMGPTGATAGDQLCQGEATAAGLTGSYMALLPTLTQSAADRFGSLAGPWRRPDGALVTLDALDAGLLDTPITTDAAGTPNLGLFAFGATDLHGLAQAADSCDGWTNPAGTITASSSRFVEPFSAQFGGSCATTSVVCAELGTP